MIDRILLGFLGAIMTYLGVFLVFWGGYGFYLFPFLPVALIAYPMALLMILAGLGVIAFGGYGLFWNEGIKGNTNWF